MSTPARLHPKVTPVSTEEKIESWALGHAHILLPLAFIILGILFVLLCYAIVGVSATESGSVYNHLQDVI